jgi:hypothetical protein
MQQNGSSNSKRLLECTDRYAELVQMQICDCPAPPDADQVTVLKPTPFSNRVKPNRIIFTLDLSLRQTEIRNPTLLGFQMNETIRFGLQRGTLKMALKNGIMPRTSIQLGRLPLTSSIDIEYQEEHGLEASASSTSVVKIGSKKAKRSKETVPQILCEGSEESPCWKFEKVVTGMNGQTSSTFVWDIPSTELGKLHINARPCSANFTFEIEQKDIFFIGTSGLWLKGIHGASNPNSYKGLRVKLYKEYIESKVKPYVSHAKVTYE